VCFESEKFTSSVIGCTKKPSELRVRGFVHERQKNYIKLAERVDPEHRRSSRIQVAQFATALTGPWMVMIATPRCNVTRMSAVRQVLDQVASAGRRSRDPFVFAGAGSAGAIDGPASLLMRVAGRILQAPAISVHCYDDGS
jgi:hypothetical protein